MDCNKIIYTGHAFQRMYERHINKQDIREAVRFGEVIMEYPNDRPFPSCLLLFSIGERPLHLVVAIDYSTKTCYIVTIYEPNPDKWDNDFKQRRK
ncbi:MAG: DUF4258 domain-containing protein [Candidatus Hatepunaea meridiana]|nr:DUF4258 domain-containing protein [Candidatus Hatepunaea meridiana]